MTDYNINRISLALTAIKSALERLILAYPAIKNMDDNGLRLDKILSDIDEFSAVVRGNKIASRSDLFGFAHSVLDEINFLFVRWKNSSSINVHAGEELKELENLLPTLDGALEKSDKAETKLEILNHRLEQAQERLAQMDKMSHEHLKDLQEQQDAMERQFGLFKSKVETIGVNAHEIGQRIERYILERKEDAFGALATAKNDINSRSIEALSQIEQDLEMIRVCRNQAEELVGTVASSSLAGGYAKSAAAEQAIADKLRVGCFCLMVLVIFVLAFTLHELSTSQPPWQNVVFRLIISFLLTLPIGYCAKEASRHRTHAVDLRKTSLDMAAFDPYIKSLPENVQNELKKDIAQRIFFAAVNKEVSPTYDLNLQEIVLKALDVTSRK